MQTQAKITVVEELPKDVKLRSVGYHGSTRGNFDSMARDGVDFNRTGKNFEGRSTYGTGLYVTPERGYAVMFANNAYYTSSQSMGFRGGEETKPEVAQVFVEQETESLAEMSLPPRTTPLNIEPYRDAMREAHLVHLDPTQSIVTERGAQSEDVNFYVLRNQ